MGGWWGRREKVITTGSASHAQVHIRRIGVVRAWDEDRRGRQLLANNRVVIRGG